MPAAATIPTGPGFTTFMNPRPTPPSIAVHALNATTGEPLWHSRVGPITNAPITYELDGLQYVVVASGGTVFSFVLN
mgnify:CR=1 FL=1